MSSPVEQASLVLIRHLAGGKIEWVPLDMPLRHIPAAPGEEYALIDRASYEVPPTLIAQRRGEDLVVKVLGTEVLVLVGFLTTANVSFYTTTDLAGGAGPFSGARITPDAPVLPGHSPDEQVVWSAARADDAETAPTQVSAVGASHAPGHGDASPMLWIGVAAGGLGLAALAGGGGGSGGGENASGGVSVAPPPPPVDTTPPQITSSGTPPGIAENSGAAQVVYRVTATDAGTVVYSLKAVGDSAAFSMNANSGAVTLTGNPDAEAKASYSFTVVATDTAGNRSERDVTLAINDIDDSPPRITSGATGRAISENSGSGQLIYTVTSTDNDDISSGNTTYSLRQVNDSGAFTINTNTGAVTLTDNPDFETKSGYQFTVVATDAAGNSSQQAVTLAINNRDETPPLGDTTPPSFTSSTPQDGAKDVPVGESIVLSFSENVQPGSGKIVISDDKDTRTIDVTDASQVSVRGNQITINPVSDLDPHRNYHVNMGSGVLIDEAGNPFAGFKGAALEFRTQEQNKASSFDQGDRIFESSVNPEIHVRISNDSAMSAAEAVGWSGSANLGSDDRTALASNFAVFDGQSAFVNQEMADAVTDPWKSLSGDDDGPFVATSLAPLADAFYNGHGGQESIVSFASMAAIMTSQGLA